MSELRLYKILSSHPERWFTNRELAKATGICERTVSYHTLRVARWGLCERVELYPGYRFRWTGGQHKEYAMPFSELAKKFLA